MSPRRSILRFCFVLIIVIALFGSGQRPVLSATNLVFTVNSTQDLNDFAVGNSVCSANQVVDGPCTLRVAITEANANIGTPNQNIVIQLPGGEYDLTIPPDYLTSDDNHSGDLNIDFVGVTITNSITIEPTGNGQVIIKSAIEDRILSVDINAKVFINNLTMRDGNVFLDTNNVNGGGSIWNRGNLYLNGVDLLVNTVSCRNGNGCASAGGAIENWGNVTLQDATLDGNTALQGGAVWNNGNLTIAYSTLSNNHTSSSGNITNYANLTIYNSTFSGNTSEYNSLSGIYNRGPLIMQSTTMANVGDNSAIFNIPGGNTKILMDNIFKAEPEHTNCTISAGSTWTSSGYNIANDDSCRLIATGDLPSVDPQLGSFGNWGGPTKTFLLNANSPALNHRTGTCQTIQFPILDDQRHWPRDDGKCDTGAYEYSPFFLYLPLITK